MGRTTAILIALGLCLMAALLEGVCAGKNVKDYFAKLKQPSYSAPLWFWYTIGVVYYAIFFIVLYRTLISPPELILRNATLALVLIMMGVNASWNFIFFRAQNLFISFVVVSLFPVLDVALLLCLIQLDKIAAWTLAPYLLYRLYSLWWGVWLICILQAQTDAKHLPDLSRLNNKTSPLQLGDPFGLPALAVFPVY